MNSKISRASKKINFLNFFHFPIFISNFSVMMALLSLINEPEPSHPIRADVAEEFQKDHKKFMKTAEEHTRKHAEKRPE